MSVRCVGKLAKPLPEVINSIPYSFPVSALEYILSILDTYAKHMCAQEIVDAIRPQVLSIRRSLIKHLDLPSSILRYTETPIEQELRSPDFSAMTDKALQHARLMSVHDHHIPTTLRSTVTPDPSVAKHTKERHARQVRRVNHAESTPLFNRSSR